MKKVRRSQAVIIILNWLKQSFSVWVSLRCFRMELRDGRGATPPLNTFLDNYWPYNYFHTKHPTLLLHVKKIKLSFVDLLVFKVDEVCNISNKYKRPYNLAKYQYFYTKGFISLLHFETKLALSIVKVFQNIQFLPNFHYFQQWVRLALFQIMLTS